MMKISSLLIAVLLLSSCQEKGGHKTDKTTTRKSSKEPELVYWYYGEPPPVGYFKALKDVYGRYGARVEIKEGCEVTEEQIRTIGDHNKALHQSIERQHPGTNGDSINKRIDKYSRLYDEIFTALDENKSFKAFQKEAIARGLSTDFSIAQEVGGTSTATGSGMEKVTVFLIKNDTAITDKQLIYSFNSRTHKLTLLPQE